MSSRGRCRGELGLTAVEFVGGQAVEDLIAEAATQRPNGLGLGVAGGHPLGQVVASGTLALELGDGDPMEGDEPTRRAQRRVTLIEG